ncbi:MAG: hypothetical protein RLZZ187_583 [Pseudomonadota bacterium]|jgi:GT2 family glycosyltransferase
MSGPLIFVTATRTSRAEFEATSPLGLSLPRVGQLTPLQLRLFAENSAPLGQCYNAAIEEAPAGAILVFVHDDVRIDDWMAGARIADGLRRFDVLGLAGNIRRQPGQETWYMRPGRLVDGVRHIAEFDHPHLSGAIGHGMAAVAAITVYGAAPVAVRLLDGVFLAARADRLRESGVRFDPALGFHLYDLDFCRAAEAAGLSLGTWPIAVTHASAGGSVQSAAWAEACTRYLVKYNEGPATP